MPLWKIAWRSIQQRGLASSLTMFSMALGVMLVVAVLLVLGVVQESFRTNASLGYNMIVGPKGGKLQLVLNTVYYLSEPIENIPYDFYLDFVTAEEVQKLHTPAELAQLRERRNSRLTRGQLEFFAARWLGGRLEHDVCYALAAKWWQQRSESARRGDAERHWERLPAEKKEAMPKAAFVEFAAGDVAHPPSDLAAEEFLALARRQLRERFVNLVMAWRTDSLSDEQQQAIAEFELDQHFQKLLDWDLLDGPFSREFDDKTPNLAIPVCLGDYYKQYRVVGTSTKLFDELEYIPEENRKYAFALGRNFKYWDEENGFFEAVVGHTVAKEYKLKLGDKLVASHGAAESDPSKLHTESAFTVVGILRPSGTPNDRAVFVNMEGFYLMEGHAKPVVEDELTIDQLPPIAAGAVDEKNGSGDDAGEPAGDAASGNDGARGESGSQSANRQNRPAAALTKTPRRTPLPLEEREVTAILFRCKDPFAAMAHTNVINEGQIGMAVLPIQEITVLFDMIVMPIQTLLLVVTALICVVSGMSILVSIYNSMNERKHEIAVMRALGAGRSTVMAIVLMESIFISLAGGALGWLAAHVGVWAAAGRIEELTGVRVGLLDFVTAEVILIPALLILAIIVGLLPAITAYRTDVAKSLQ